MITPDRVDFLIIDSFKQYVRYNTTNDNNNAKTTTKQQQQQKKNIYIYKNSEL